MGFDFLMVSDSHGTPLAGVIREGGRLTPFQAPPAGVPIQGLMMRGDKVYQIASVPVDQGEENVGGTVGRRTI